MDHDLKTCPFCGEKPEVLSLDGDEENWSISCLDCQVACVENWPDETLDDIKKKWNRRIDSNGLHKII